MAPNFATSPDGLLPAIVQDADTRQVLMLGYMNAEALATTRQTGKVTFFSRSKGRLWTKGETSGHYLHLVGEIEADCDGDTLLVRAHPHGPTCHTGTDTCWAETNRPHYGFITELEDLLRERHATRDVDDDSYTRKLFRKGVPKLAQKVGEEAVEVAIEAVKADSGHDVRTELVGEAADLLFHYLVLLRGTGVELEAVLDELRRRHKK